MDKTQARRILRYAVFFLLVMFIASWARQALNPPEVEYEEVGFMQVHKAISQDVDRIESVELKARSKVVEVVYKPVADNMARQGLRSSYAEGYEGELNTLLINSEVEFSIDPEPTTVGEMLLAFLPWLIFIGIILFIFMRGMNGQYNRAMSFGKSKAKLLAKNHPKTTFDDVAGLDEAKEELEEIKDFLKDSSRYRQMGAKIPKGVLLFGPPGTGKTLMARAVAGEAGVPFLSISGSDFVEMFVGVGASRVRDMFEQAKESAPCIIFIDEIDAVGRHRGTGLGGGHDEREQTLNQLLTEMDGFAGNTGVIVIAATNRPDVLDPALLRPGRFDRQIIIDAPDVEGREAILKVHSKGKPLADDINLGLLAKQTPGFTGADLANLINEAAILAARRHKEVIEQEELQEAIDKIIAGPEKKNSAMTAEDKKIIAYHETGHTLVGYALPDADPVQKVTIVARGRSLGHTLALPDRDKYLVWRQELLDKLAMLLGGRAAEEVFYGGEYTTGASNDIEKATEIAEQMLTSYGMSRKLGALKYGKGHGNPFLGKQMAEDRNYGPETSGLIDEEKKAIVDAALEEARRILTAHRDAVERMVGTLIEKETVAGEEIDEVFHDVPKKAWQRQVLNTI